MNGEIYEDEFFRGHEEGSLRSAREIVPAVVDLTRPRSVIDVGCGVGTWLSVFRACGVDDIVGVDGDYVRPESLRIPHERFVAHDLRTPLRLDRAFDLVVSLEVAEHLPEECADLFVDSLTSLGPAVLFSAAVPHQSGVEHVNEQWPGYWAELFAERGYEVVDCVRRRVWGNERVEVWYAQNTLLFVTPAFLRQRPTLLAEPRPDPTQLAVVHPRFFLAALGSAQDNLAARTLLARLPGAIARAVTHRVGKALSQVS